MAPTRAPWASGGALPPTRVGAPLPGASAASLGYVEGELPPGSRRLLPLQDGDQGISASERPHAEQAIKRLFEAEGVDMVAMFNVVGGTYELRSRTGFIRWERWATPTGEVRYRIVAQGGENPIPNVDGTILATIEEEAAAAGGIGKPVPKQHNSYPDMLARIAQLFDNARAPEFVYIPTNGGDPNHPGAGSHGIPDMVQSRSPLVIAAPGVARGAVVDMRVRHEDVAPTVAELLGVHPVLGTNATGVQRTQLLRWQDGHSVASSIEDGRTGAAYGSAERAIIFTIDGMSQTALLDEVKAGRAPNFARIMRAGTMFRNGSLAEYPTVTWANHNTLMTGASPGHTGLVNNSWWDRTTQTERLITDGGWKNSLRTGQLMDPKVETIYEAVERSFPGARTMAVNQPSGRGADIDILGLHGIPSLLANAAKIAVNFLRGRSTIDKDAEANVDDWKSSTQQDLAGTAIGEAYFSKATPPKLGVFEYTLVDSQGHRHGPHSEAGRRALQQVDRQVGRVLDTIEKRGIAGSTAIVLTADHGMEHQELDTAKLGGWFEALDRAAADGAKTKESTRFVYVRSVDWKVVGAVPAAGTSGELAIAIANDDAAADGSHPKVPGATVTVRDGAGHTWSGVSDADGVVHLPIAATAGPLHVTIEHTDFSTEQGTIPLPTA
ncbi:MAG: type phosphodiesterase/nucleotide pyrophosphatase [Thermoleophilia bacterium]|nr:type phosphodiesterase/nucleotide pyrophosphatase [Thermoleophilia bacterium]